MDIFGILTMLGGLALFMYGMDVMGKNLEKQAGNKLHSILERLTANPYKGFVLGMIVTAVIQSSSATTVMVVGFVNSGLMKLSQACSVIMGANVGTTITSWILSLTGLQGDSVLIRMLKPSSFTPILAMAGVIMAVFMKKDKLKGVGNILLGFAILMFGMETMSDAVKPLADIPQFQQLFVAFSNPVLGVLVGALVTAVIQSSSASVGILQALSATGAITYGAAIPIIMGQNIGTCATALISVAGTNRNARRASMVHLYFNLIGVAVFLSLYCIFDGIIGFAFADMQVDALGIAIVHTCFNVLATATMLPFNRQLEKLAYLTIPEKGQKPEKIQPLDERLMTTPGLAVEQSRRVTLDMARTARTALLSAIDIVHNYNEITGKAVMEYEDDLDKYEDKLGTYLVHLSSKNLTETDSREVSKLLHIIGDLERIGDHAVNLAEAAQEVTQKKLRFTDEARAELAVIENALYEIVQMAIGALETENYAAAARVEPLEEVIDDLTKALKKRHIDRLQAGNCTIEMGFVHSDLLTNYERIADHCSNIAVALLEARTGNFDMHGYINNLDSDEFFKEKFREYSEKYALPC